MWRWLRNTLVTTQEYKYTHTHTHTQEVNGMYIHPFLCGVLVTIGIEIAALVATALVTAVRRVKKDGNFRQR